jgi:two-component system sensor histidine kinase KdpD
MLAIIACTAASLLLLEFIALGNVALFYLVPVMFAAATFGLRAGLFAGVVSSLAYNFFFLPPTGTLTVSNPENVVSIFVLLGVAIVTSHFAARVKAQADLAQSSARQNAALAGFSRQLTSSANQEDLMHAICAEISRMLDCQTVMLLPSREGPQLRAAYPPENRLEQIEKAAAQWSMDNGQPAGRGSTTLTASDWLFHPLQTTRGILGVIGFSRDDAREPVRSDQIPLLMSLLDQASIAFDRMTLEEEMQDARQLRERDRLRSALLSSVSHDLRTPLTTILSTIHELRQAYSPELIDTLEGEAQRLNRFVANLLDMVRVEAGALSLRVEATDLTDAVGAAVHDTRRSLAGHPIVLDIPPDMPLIRVDARLFHHCLINLLDNAGRYANPETPVKIEGIRTPSGIDLSVIDEGPGIPAGKEERIFDTFTRIEGSDRSKGGTGLGLAIVKGFAEAMGLGVFATNNVAPAGARFTIHVPTTAIVLETSEAMQ